jgi:hypothetical protein
VNLLTDFVLGIIKTIKDSIRAGLGTALKIIYTGD